MPRLLLQLALERCPHCGVARPLLIMGSPHHSAETSDGAGANIRRWRFYTCQTCGGIVTACAPGFDFEVTEQYPRSHEISGDIPQRARDYLAQALESAPAGAVMLAASAVDSMLKAMGLGNGSLYSRIDEAAKQHVITDDMAQWAHQVRLEANDQRHADDAAPLPTPADAARSIEFAKGLALVLFELPARVTRGIAASAPAP